VDTHDSFIVDNSDEHWKALEYLRQLAQRCVEALLADRGSAGDAACACSSAQLDVSVCTGPSSCPSTENSVLS
jgi:hypothetical protein